MYYAYHYSLYGYHYYRYGYRNVYAYHYSLYGYHYYRYGYRYVLYTNIDQTFVSSLHGLLNCEIGGLDGYVITT